MTQSVPKDDYKLFNLFDIIPDSGPLFHTNNGAPCFSSTYEELLQSQPESFTTKTAKINFNNPKYWLQPNTPVYTPSSADISDSVSRGGAFNFEFDSLDTPCINDVIYQSFSGFIANQPFLIFTIRHRSWRPAPRRRSGWGPAPACCPCRHRSRSAHGGVRHVKAHGDRDHRTAFEFERASDMGRDLDRDQRAVHRLAGDETLGSRSRRVNVGPALIEIHWRLPHYDGRTAKGNSALRLRARFASFPNLV